MGLSGYLPLAHTLVAERSPANADVPIFLAHGREDSVVPLPRATASRDFLRTLSYDVQWHDYAMDHSLCAEEIEDMRAWLCRVLA
jgi:phospholipase/carboxylesterase